MWCIVNLPNGTQQAVKFDTKSIGQDLLEKVCKALGIVCEMEYFGLEYWTPNQEETNPRQWINLRNRLSCDNGSSGIQLMLALRVKFWVPVHFILQESVRELFYMQAKSDLLEGHLVARDWKNAAKLAALLCQADGIRFNENSLKTQCPTRTKNPFHFLVKHLQSSIHQKERKDRENVLNFKKRRLSKQKSVENIENSSLHGVASEVLNTTSSYVSSISSTVRSITFTTTTTTTTTTTPNTNANALSSTNTNGHGAILNENSIQTVSSSASSSSQNDSETSKSTSSFEDHSATCPLRIYRDYIVRPENDPFSPMPDDFLRQIATEHGKLSMLKMAPKSAKYWLLKGIQDLSGYGEEVFSGICINDNSVRCEISVGAHGITLSKGDEKNSISFSAIAAAKSFRRTFKLEYLDDLNNRKELEIKLSKHAFAAGLYRSITERHAFYVCDKVRGVVTTQFTRDLKGTIASMFKEDTELGKRYVFDIQHTCREVHDQARRTLHERGINISTYYENSSDIINYLPRTTTLEDATVDDCAFGFSNGFNFDNTTSMVGQLDSVIKEREEREAVIERCVDSRISEAMTCKICMDQPINTMFSPCCHVIACTQCAARCINCPNCRIKITSSVKIFLPPELRISQPEITPHQNDKNPEINHSDMSTYALPKLTAAT